MDEAILPAVAAAALAGHGHDDQGADSSSSTASSSESSSSAFSSLVSRLQRQFLQLTMALQETHHNMHTHEFMLSQSRQIATIKPFAQPPHSSSATRDATAVAGVLEEDPRVEKLLRDLSEAVGRVSEMKAQMVDVHRQDDTYEQKYRECLEENHELKLELERQRQKVSEAETKLQFTERELQSKCALNEQLAESAHRSRAALQEERERSEKLDRRLDSEQRAAQKVGQDITRYVETMKALEAEVISLRKESRKRHKSETRTSKAHISEDLVGNLELGPTKSQADHADGAGGDLLALSTLQSELQLSKNTVEQFTLEMSQLQEHLRSETGLRKALESKIVSYEDQIHDYESQLTELKGGLETLHAELEKCQQASNRCMVEKVTMTTPREDKATSAALPAPSAEVEDLRAKLVKASKDLTSLKFKSKKLIHQYQLKKESHEKLKTRLKHVGTTLKDIQTVCARAEKNYREVANHLGSELEICARLLAAYLDLTPEFRPVQVYGRELSSWFQDIGAISAWLRAQIVAFGKRLWTEKDTVAHVIPFPALPVPNKSTKKVTLVRTDELKDGLNTLSEISEALVHDDEDTVKSVLDAVQNQDLLLQVRDTALNDLLAQVK